MKVAFDTELRRPGCVIVAASLGADTEPCSHFAAATWITHPTPGMRVFETTPEQLTILVRMVEAEA
jgi:hypothetical protein